MFKLNAVRFVFFMVIGLWGVLSANTLPCTFTFNNICLNIQPHAGQFKKISVRRSRPAGEVNLYFWFKDQPEKFLSNSDLKEQGYTGVAVLMDMSHMLSFENISSVPACIISKAKKEGQWIKDSENRNTYQVLSSIQAGVYFVQVNLLKSDGDYIGMQRQNENDLATQAFVNYLDAYDADNEVMLALLPMDNTHYFGVAPETTEAGSVKLYLKP